MVAVVGEGARVLELESDVDGSLAATAGCEKSAKGVITGEGKLVGESSWANVGVGAKVVYART